MILVQNVILHALPQVYCFLLLMLAPLLPSFRQSEHNRPRKYLLLPTAKMKRRSLEDENENNNTNKNEEGIEYSQLSVAHCDPSCQNGGYTTKWVSHALPPQNFACDSEAAAAAADD
ncbi:hypothetical protein EDB19DRAFT_671598 [Suillus lakei]|nr:hypothetical protein EDB19DRAFT_671598 [Suillus lakei]